MGQAKVGAREAPEVLEAGLTPGRFCFILVPGQRVKGGRTGIMVHAGDEARGIRRMDDGW